MKSGYFDHMQLNNKNIHIRKYLFTFIFGTVLFALSSVLCGCSSQTCPLSGTGFYFNTVIGITIYDAGDKKLLEECFAIAAEYENMLSRTKENSDIWNINHAKGSPVTVSDATIELLDTALYYSELSAGNADLTIGAVNNLWNFTGTDTSSLSCSVNSGNPPESGKLPDASLLAEAVSHVDYRCVSLSGNTVTLSDPAAEIDLGFIAKGYIADRMKEYLISEGVESALINLGGNVLTIGTKPDGSPFRIGIQKPFADSGTCAFTLSADDMSVVSSGIYERCFELDGILYHHILDTKTGYPIQNNLLQVTVLSSSSTESDALSTVCFALGEEKGMELIESLDSAEAVFTTSDGRLISSGGIILQ